MNPTIPLLAMDNLSSDLTFNLTVAADLEEENTKFKPVVLLKIDLVSHPAREREQGQIHTPDRVSISFWHVIQNLNVL